MPNWNQTLDCPVCNGRIFVQRLKTRDRPAFARWVKRRETVGLVCQKCGWDYGQNGEPWC